MNVLENVLEHVHIYVLRTPLLVCIFSGVVICVADFFIEL